MGDLSFLVEKYPYRKQTWLQRLSLHLDEWSILRLRCGYGSDLSDT